MNTASAKRAVARTAPFVTQQSPGRCVRHRGIQPIEHGCPDGTAPSAYTLEEKVVLFPHGELLPLGRSSGEGARRSASRNHSTDCTSRLSPHSGNRRRLPLGDAWEHFAFLALWLAALLGIIGCVWFPG